MVDHQSKEVVDKISDELKIQPAGVIPRAIMDRIQLVYGINPTPPTSIVRSTNLTISTTGTSIHVVPFGKTFFMTYALISEDSDANADNTILNILAANDGVRGAVFRIVKRTLTASQQTKCINFSPPIRIIEGTDIEFVNTFSVGASNSSAIIGGYEVDNQ